MAPSRPLRPQINLDDHPIRSGSSIAWAMQSRQPVVPTICHLTQARRFLAAIVTDAVPPDILR